MNPAIHPETAPTFLGIECGGTHTVALLAGASGQLLKRCDAGPANLRLLSDARLIAHFRSIRRQLGIPAAVGVGIAGARGAEDCARVTRLLDRVWPGVPSRVGHDLESALAAAHDGQSAPSVANARLIILAGTGSCTYGQNTRGVVAKVGGWGHLLGDHGSGYDIGFNALRRIVADYDQAGQWTPMAQAVLRVLGLNDPEELIAWVQQASKRDIAALATQVFKSSESSDARDILQQSAQTIGTDAVMCARQLGCQRHPVDFVFAGGVFTRQPSQVARVTAAIRRARRGLRDRFRVLERESAWGAVSLAEQAFKASPLPHRVLAEKGGSPLLVTPRRASGELEVPVPRATGLSVTEQRNPRSMELDRLSVDKAIELMISEDELIPRALRAQKKQIGGLIRRVVRALRSGGRLFYVGAGTSGRLGVLDASECPPTFRSDPEQVQGIMAGGVPALHTSVEGAEDDIEAGARAVVFRSVGVRDIVVGIAASGRTPFIWGALAEARRRHAVTALLCCNPNLKFAHGSKPDVVVSLDLGAELLTGSTRLKSGTATKLVLNMVTTLAMVRLGKVLSNLMVDLNPSNMKLRDRAIRIVCELTECSRDEATRTLESTRWGVKEAVFALRKSR